LIPESLKTDKKHSNDEFKPAKSLKLVFVVPSPKSQRRRHTSNFLLQYLAGLSGYRSSYCFPKYSGKRLFQ